MRKSVSNTLKLGSILVSKRGIRPFFTRKTFSVTHQTQFNFSMATQNHKNISRSTYQGPKFYVQQMLTGCLALYSYYIESGDQALIIDPQNDITKYIEVLERRNKKLKAVFLSHYHADYISGHYELKKKYGCEIYMGPNAVELNGFTILKDHQKLKLGHIQLQLIHTPGHTEESSCLLMYNGDKKPSAVFTGDTLFLNEVGRPDLAIKTNLTAADLAQRLFDSIQKLKKLDGDVRVYPGHGAGSSCGKSIGSGDFCDIATQKQNNYALKATDKSQFVKQILNQMPNPPQYFGYDANINKFNPFSFEEAYNKIKKQLTPQQVYALMQKQDAIVIDVRGKKDIVRQGIIQGSIAIGFDGPFATWVGTLLNPHNKYIVYGLPEQTQDTIKRLLRIGYINIKGYAQFDIREWKQRNLPHYIPDMISPQQVQSERQFLDIRKPKEWATKHLNTDNRTEFQLSNLFKNVHQLNPNKKYAIHCQSGYRSIIGYSFLKNHGYDVKYYPCDLSELAEKSKIGLKNLQ